MKREIDIKSERKINDNASSPSIPLVRLRQRSCAALSSGCMSRLYDIFRLVEDAGVSLDEVFPLFEQKAVAKGLDPATFSDKFADRIHRTRADGTKRCPTILPSLHNSTTLCVLCADTCEGQNSKELSAHFCCARQAFADMRPSNSLKVVRLEGRNHELRIAHLLQYFATPRSDHPSRPRNTDFPALTLICNTNLRIRKPMLYRATRANIG